MDRWQNFVHWRLCGLVVLLVASLVEPAKAELPSMDSAQDLILRSSTRGNQDFVYPDEVHGFARPENNIDFAGRAEELLHEAIGGRVEPWQKVPGATGELK
jgi:hypothetical protein